MNLATNAQGVPWVSSLHGGRTAVPHGNQEGSLIWDQNTKCLHITLSQTSIGLILPMWVVSNDADGVPLIAGCDMQQSRTKDIYYTIRTVSQGPSSVRANRYDEYLLPSDTTLDSSYSYKMEDENFTIGLRIHFSIHVRLLNKFWLEHRYLLPCYRTSSTCFYRRPHHLMATSCRKYGYFFLIRPI